MQNQSSMKVRSFGIEGRAFVEDGVLKVRYPGKSLTKYTASEAQKVGMELLDATRKDLKALREAGFIFVLKEVEKV